MEQIHTCRNCKHSNPRPIYFTDETGELQSLWSNKLFIAHCPIQDEYVYEDEHCNRWEQKTETVYEVNKDGTVIRQIRICNNTI